MSFSNMTILRTILFQNGTLKPIWFSTFILMPFSHVTSLGRAFKLIFKFTGADTQENVDTISLHNLMV